MSNKLAHSEPLQQCSVVGSASKPTHVKPSFYAFIYEQIKEIAKDYGYNLVLHGSMNRDLDLIAIPWIDNPKPELELVHIKFQLHVKRQNLIF